MSSPTSPSTPSGSSQAGAARRTPTREASTLSQAGRARILVADDERAILDFVSHVLTDAGYEVTLADDGENARRLLDSEGFDLLLTDLKMPGLDGLALLQHAAGLGGPMRCIAMTGYASVETAIQALKLGADNYVIKPFRPAEVRIAVERALERQRLIRENEEYQRGLETQVEQRTEALRQAHHQLELTYDQTLRGIAALLEHKESDSTGRSIRVADLTARIGRALGLAGDDLEDLWRGALLHDIGKFAIPDAILFKRGTRTPNEQLIFNTYCVIGYKAIESIPFLTVPAKVVLHHQERWDGSGYPCGLIGDEIPVGARVFAVASAYQDLRDGHEGRAPASPADARDELARWAGTALDPGLVEALMEIPEADLP